MSSATPTGPSPTYSGAGGSSTASTGTGPTISIVDPTAPDPIGTATATSTGTQPGVGLLTAGTWDDNLNFGFYSAYLTQTTSSLAGTPVIGRADRMVILVKSAGGQPVAGASVTVTDGQGHTWSSIQTRWLRWQGVHWRLWTVSGYWMTRG